MTQLSSVLLIILRIYIFAKLVYLFWMTSLYPENYPISLLTWWIYFLIFDLWLNCNVTTKDVYQNSDNEKD
jgi:hypothetical protein